MRVLKCVSAIGAMEVPVFVCLRISCNHAIMLLKKDHRNVCETRVEGSTAKLRGLCGNNPAMGILYFDSDL